MAKYRYTHAAIPATPRTIPSKTPLSIGSPGPFGHAQIEFRQLPRICLRSLPESASSDVNLGSQAGYLRNSCTDRIAYLAYDGPFLAGGNHFTLKFVLIIRTIRMPSYRV